MGSESVMTYIPNLFRSGRGPVDREVEANAFLILMAFLGVPLLAFGALIALSALIGWLSR